jgi:DNA-binding MarR family transcriptional regulator
VTRTTQRRTAREVLTDELVDELTAWTPRDRLRMLGAWHHSGLSLAHLNVVTLLEMHGPMSMGRIAELMGVSLASATGIVSRMEERDLVVRRGSPTDRRVVEVHIGEGGRELLGSIRDRRQEHLRDVFRRMDETQLASLHQGLRAMRAARATLEQERDRGERTRPDGLGLVRRAAARA